MNLSKRLNRRLPVAATSLLMFTLFTPTALLQQSGGPYTINPSVVAGGGGSSANGNTSVEGTIGQGVLGSSSGGSYTLDSGFWPNAVSCPTALSSAADFFTMSGGSGSVNVITATACSWSVTASLSWITITSADTGSGNDTITFEVRENFTASARQGTINVAGVNYVIVQDGGLGEDCGYSISPLFQSFAGLGGNGTMQVIAADRCAWQAVSTVSWVTITSVSAGIGDSIVNYSVAPNPGASGRKGTITIGGQTFAVKQKGN